MKSEKRILLAFLLNLFFSLVEFVGGTLTGSVAIVSDSIHDLGDSLSIGISYFLESISKKEPDEKHTYGYSRFSVLGSVITTSILLVGSAIMIYRSVLRILNPVEINYNGMIILAVFGAVINLVAAYFTHDKSSLNVKAINLHMLEDVLGWVVVLVGAIVMKFTDIAIIDPLLSIGVAIFILVSAIKNLKVILDVFLEKTPSNVSLKKITEKLCEIDGVVDVHHLHVWSIDGYNNFATLHLVTEDGTGAVKKEVKKQLSELSICHATVETEKPGEDCEDQSCHPSHNSEHHHHHGHHHHHHHGHEHHEDH